MHSITELPAWERLFKKIVWEQLGDLEGKKILDFASGEGITYLYPTLSWIFYENALLGILFGICYIEFIEDASNE